MATIQKFFTGEYNEKGEKLFFYQGQKITSRNYIADIESEIVKALKLTPATRVQDQNGVDFIDKNGFTYQLKILCDNRATVTFDIDFDFNKNGLHSRNFYRFRNYLQAYAKKFDFLLVYFGNSNIGSQFDISNLVLINSSEAIFDFFATRLYRGYAQNFKAQCGFNKTPCSEFLGHFYSEAEFLQMLANVLDNAEFYGTSVKRRNIIERKYLGRNLILK